MGAPGEQTDKHRLLAWLRHHARVLEAEVGAVVDDATAPESTDPRTLIARERLLTEAERIAQVGSWAWHLGTNTVYWSDQMFRIFGVDPSRHGDLFDAFLAGVHPDDRARVVSEQVRLREQGVLLPSELRVVRSDGTVRVVRAEGAPVLDASGTIVRVVGTIQDITERRDAERQRLRDEEMLRAAESLAGVGSYRWVMATNEVVWSEQFKRLIGVPPDFAPSFEAFLKRLSPADAARLQDSTARAVGSGTTESLGVEVHRDDGTVRQVVLEGRFIGGGEMLGSMLDVTEVKRLEADLLQAQKLEALGRLAGGIAHDFNNILAVLKLGLEARTKSEAVFAELAIAIDRGASLTRQLLTFSRKNLLEPRVIDLNGLLAQSVELVGRLLGDAIEVRQTAEAGLTVTADATQLQQALINLMVNARDAMPAGGTIWLTTRACTLAESPAGVRPRLRPGSYVEVEVRDEGTGIEPAVLPNIFDPFFTTKPSGEGTGLGLATVFASVSQAGGGVAVASARGAGTTFRLFLPRAGAMPAEAEPNRPSAAVGHGQRILVFEDLPAVRRVVAMTLEMAGFEAVCVEDVSTVPGDAARLAASCSVVVTDLDMPGLSGPDVARLLWRHAPALPVLFISGHRSSQLPSSGAAPTAFLGKPFSGAELIEKLTQLLGPAS